MFFFTILRPLLNVMYIPVILFINVLLKLFLQFICKISSAHVSAERRTARSRVLPATNSDLT